MTLLHRLSKYQTPKYTLIHDGKYLSSKLQALTNRILRLNCAYDKLMMQKGSWNLFSLSGSKRDLQIQSCFVHLFFYCLG